MDGPERRADSGIPIPQSLPKTVTSNASMFYEKDWKFNTEYFLLRSFFVEQVVLRRK